MELDLWRVNGHERMSVRSIGLSCPVNLPGAKRGIYPSPKTIRGKLCKIMTMQYNTDTCLIRFRNLGTLTACRTHRVKHLAFPDLCAKLHTLYIDGKTVSYVGIKRKQIKNKRAIYARMKANVERITDKIIFRPGRKSKAYYKKLHS